MTEQWRQLYDFPNYSVSNYGRVLNTEYDRIKEASINQAGIPNVNLQRRGTQNRRSVAVLVAEAFLEKPNRHFDSPINVDGDRTNNHVENLMWRPRWFAIKYHKQFQTPPWGFRSPIRCVETEDVYDNSFAVVKHLGVLELDVINSVSTHKQVFPYGYTFERNEYIDRFQTGY